jgi:hypothetical protein
MYGYDCHRLGISKLVFEAFKLLAVCSLKKDAHEDITAVLVAILVLHSFHSMYILPALPPSMTASQCLEMYLSYVAPHNVSLLHIPNHISFLRSPKDVSLVHSPNDVSFLLSPYSLKALPAGY